MFRLKCSPPAAVPNQDDFKRDALVCHKYSKKLCDGGQRDIAYANHAVRRHPFLAYASEAQKESLEMGVWMEEEIPEALGIDSNFLSDVVSVLGNELRQ